MTEQVVQEEEVQANPYNQNKAWHKEDMKPFVSSDSLFFKEETPEQPSEESVEEVEVEAESKDKPYKRPNYKKRYDDLKKHYDSKLNEFKAREQELLEEATKNRTEYQAPKTEEAVSYTHLRAHET